MNETVLAVDLGGTNLRMAAVGPGGEILAHARSTTPENCDPQMLLTTMESLAKECRAALAPEREIVGIGVGAPANIGPQHGVLRNLPNLRQLEGMDLKTDLSARFHIPVTLENDATAAAIGENWLGASRDVTDSIMITLGTGVGGGVIINNEALRGIDGTAGKIGHMNVEPDGVPCKCGSHGCIEQYASATALVRMGREAGLEVSSSLDVYRSAQSGNEAARSVFQSMGRHLGITLASLVNALNPEMIVIGGGAAAGCDAFIDHVRTEMHARAFNEPADRAQIVRSVLGDNAGILGAARSAFLMPRK
jgi:glucokinase